MNDTIYFCPRCLHKEEHSDDFKSQKMECYGYNPIEIPILYCLGCDDEIDYVDELSNDEYNSILNNKNEKPI